MGGAWETPSWQPRFDLEHTQTGSIACVDLVLVFLPPLPDISRAFFERGTTTPPRSPLVRYGLVGRGANPWGKGDGDVVGLLKTLPLPLPHRSKKEKDQGTSTGCERSGPHVRKEHATPEIQPMLPRTKEKETRPRRQMVYGRGPGGCQAPPSLPVAGARQHQERWRHARQLARSPAV